MRAGFDTDSPNCDSAAIGYLAIPEVVEPHRTPRREVQGPLLPGVSLHAAASYLRK